MINQEELQSLIGMTKVEVNIPVKSLDKLNNLAETYGIRIQSLLTEILIEYADKSSIIGHVTPKGMNVLEDLGFPKDEVEKIRFQVLEEINKRKNNES